MTRLSELLGEEAARGGGLLQAPAPELGITLWSRILGKRLGISNVTVAKIWKRWGIKPFRQETFSCSLILGVKVRKVRLELRQTTIPQRLQ